MNIRKLTNDEALPYALLLLADETREAIDRYIQACEVHVLVYGSGPVAVIAVRLEGDGSAEVLNIAVAEHLQGRGLGGRLLEDLFDRMHARGIGRVRVGCADVGAQRRFYERHGFVQVGVRKDFYLLNYPNPIIEHGVQLRDMLVLERTVER